MPTASRRRVRNDTTGTLTTTGGLGPSDLKLVSGRIVSKDRSKMAKKKDSPLKKWREAVAEARTALNVPKDEFVLLKKGTKLYKTARAIYDARCKK